MPLNKLENFIKNREGRVRYVNPNDIYSTDGIENQGNSSKVKGIPLLKYILTIILPRRNEKQ